MYILRLVLSRVAMMLVTLLIVSLIIFWSVELLRKQLHLDSRWVSRYFLWLKGFVIGDWGTSLVGPVPVKEYILPRLKNTLILAGLAIAAYVPLSLILGIVSVVFRERLWSMVLSTLLIIGTAAPPYVVGMLLLVAFAVELPWFPPLALMSDIHSFPELLHALTLPVVTLEVSMVAYAVRMMQGSLVSVMESDYVRMATLKGLPKRRVILRHALPNALGPALRATALNIAWLVGGVVMVETVYTYDGVGRTLVDSMRLLDTPMIQAIVMIMVSVYMLCNLGADIVSALLNPRLRTA
jgi:peptide/nickel transport system permease protein